MRSILPILLLALTACARLADAEVAGTVELTLDGQQQTWYGVDAGSDMLPTALWLAMGPDRAALSITAYRSPEIEFIADEATRSPLPKGDAQALVISIGFSLDANEQAYVLPTDPGDGPAVVMILSDWSNPLDSYTLTDGPGEIRLTEINANADQASRFVGTFQGTMQGSSGETKVIDNGRFEVQGLRLFER